MKSIISLLLLVLFLGTCNLFAQQSNPNVLVILADDLGAGDLGCYGSTFYETPFIDQLAAEGVKFTMAYSAGAVCSPTRSSIMSGKYPVRTGVTDYIPGLKDKNRKLNIQPTAMHLALDEVTLAETFKSAGYQTFYAGKWHLGEAGFEPQDQGFDIYMGHKELSINGNGWQIGNRLTQTAIEFIDSRDQQKPFLMYLGYNEPHTPILEYPDHIQKFKDKAKTLAPVTPQNIQERNGKTRVVQDDPVYASELAGLDSFVGRVLKKIADNNLRNNTIVMLLSDNGGLSTLKKPGPTSNKPLRAGKGWLYEGGIRIPFILRVPGLTKANSEIATPIITTDIYPTLLELAGLPAKPEQHIDGLSLVPLLKGAKSLNRTTLYWHYPHYHGSTWAPGGAIHEGDWKLIEFFEENKLELFNLKHDPVELNDLAQQEPTKLRELKQKLDNWRKETGAFIPTLNTEK